MENQNIEDDLDLAEHIIPLVPSEKVSDFGIEKSPSLSPQERFEKNSESSLSTVNQIDKMLQNTKNKTKSVAINLADFTYKQTDTGFKLVKLESASSESAGLPGAFELSELALRHLCKYAGVTFNFVMKNPASLNQQILDFWYPAIKNKVKIAHYFELDDFPVIRGFTETTVDVAPHTLFWQGVKENFKSGDVIYSHVGGDLFDPYFYLRLVKKQDFKVGPLDLRPFVDFWNSDCGGLPKFVVDIGFLDLNTDFAFVVRSSDDVYHSYPYTSGWEESFHIGACSSAISRVLSVYDFDTFEDLTTTGFINNGILDYLKSLKDKRTIPKGLVLKVIKDVLQGGYTQITHWDLLKLFFNHVVDSDFDKQIVVGAFAAKEAGLVLV